MDCDNPDFIETDDHAVEDDLVHSTNAEKLEALNQILVLHRKMIDMQNEIDECEATIDDDSLYVSSYISFTQEELKNLEECIEEIRRKIYGS